MAHRPPWIDRLIVLRAIADVRRELAGSIDTLRVKRAVVVDDVRHTVDVVLLRGAIFLVAAVVLAPLVAYAYACVCPRRWRELQTRSHLQGNDTCPF
jgi:hypothetical protein